MSGSFIFKHRTRRHPQNLISFGSIYVTICKDYERIQEFYYLQVGIQIGVDIVIIIILQTRFFFHSVIGFSSFCPFYSGRHFQSLPVCPHMVGHPVSSYVAKYLIHHLLEKYWMIKVDRPVMGMVRRSRFAFSSEENRFDERWKTKILRMIGVQSNCPE